VPLYDLNPPPVYPWVARRRHYQGTVLLDVRVTAQGIVAEVKVARSSGYPVLDRSALKSVRRWRFEPARRGSRPIETWVQVPVRFELE
jgi:protein TonB